MIKVFDSSKLAEYGVNSMPSGETIYVTDTEEIYFKTNNIEGGTPKVYRATIAASPVEAIVTQITPSVNYIYSGKSITFSITLDVDGVTDKSKLKNMKLTYGTTSVDIASVPKTLSVTASGETTFVFSGVYDKTNFSGNKKVEEVCPIYAAVVDKDVRTSESVKAAIVKDENLISPDNPRNTLDGFSKSFTYSEGQRLAFISGDTGLHTYDVKGMANDYLDINGVSITLGSKTGYVFLTTPIIATTRTNKFITNG